MVPKGQRSLPKVTHAWQELAQGCAQRHWVLSCRWLSQPELPRMPQYKSLLIFFLSFLDCFLELSSLKWSLVAHWALCL